MLEYVNSFNIIYEVDSKMLHIVGYSKGFDNNNNEIRTKAVDFYISEALSEKFFKLNEDLYDGCEPKDHSGNFIESIEKQNEIDLHYS